MLSLFAVAMVLPGCAVTHGQPGSEQQNDASATTSDGTGGSSASSDGDGGSSETGGDAITGTVSDEQGNQAKITITVGEPRAASNITDAAVQTCGTLLSNLGSTLDAAVAVPLTVGASVTSSQPVDIIARLNNVSGLTDGGNTTLANNIVLWGVKYSDTPPECQSPQDALTSGTVHWSSVTSGKSWSAWMVVAGAATPSDPDGRDAVGKLVIAPSIRLNGGFAKLQIDQPAPASVVQCSASDPAMGDASYVALVPAVALVHGCTSAADQAPEEGSDAGGDTPSADRICIDAYGDGTADTEDKVTTHDRQDSLRMVCQGFGMPAGLAQTAPMACALIAAAATFTAPETAETGDSLCNRAEIAAALRDGQWLEAGQGGVAAVCGYVGEVFAGASGALAAGASSETGPGAIAVGVTTYKSVSAGAKVVCDGLLGGGAKAVGGALEDKHEADIARDVIQDDKCIALNATHGTSYAAVDCPS